MLALSITLPNPPVPQAAGKAEGMIVENNLKPGVYNFAIKIWTGAEVVGERPNTAQAEVNGLATSVP